MRVFIYLFFISFNLNAQVLIEDQGFYKIETKTVILSQLVKEYAKLKDYDLIIAEDPKESYELYGPRRITKDDLDLFVTSILSQSSYALSVNEALKQITVMQARDIRYTSNQIFKNIEAVPNDYNYYQLYVPLNYIDSDNVSRNLRPFISRYGRVIDDRVSNAIIILDRGIQLKWISKLIKILDTKEFLRRKVAVDKINEEKKKSVEYEFSSIDEVLESHTFLFLILFLLLGGIIGFAFKGFTQSKFEQKW